VVWEISRDVPGFAAAERGEVELQGVGLHDLRAAQIVALAQDGDEVGIDFQCGDARARFDERGRERARAGADLEDAFAVRVGDAFEREPCDAMRRRGVHQEVLAEAFLRPQPACVQQRAGMHYLMR
jgi:hypothetical protein